MHPWQLIACAPEDVIVLTKVDDDEGGHNMSRLRYHDGLWYLSGGGMRGLFSTHPSTEERIARLLAMAH